jgi:hypothetical protein
MSAIVSFSCLFSCFLAAHRTRREGPASPALGLALGNSTNSLSVPPTLTTTTEPSPLQSPRSMPKLPLMVPRASTEPSVRSDWAGHESPAPLASPRTANPSRSPRPETPNPSRIARPAEEAETPPRPPKNPELDTRKQRTRVCEEIVSSEEAYVQTLQTIVGVYRDPLVVSELHVSSLLFFSFLLVLRTTACCQMRRALRCF